MINIGKFNVKGDKLLVTDPCYTIGTWCQGIVERAKPGEWQALVEHDGGRVSKLLVENLKGGMSGPWEELDADIGVDSGQAGVFDLSTYPQGETGEYGEKETFYGKCCDATLETEAGGAAVAGGAVSSSGWGDGSYVAHVSRDSEGLATAVKITFLGDDDYEDDEYEVEDETEEDDA